MSGGLGFKKMIMYEAPYVPTPAGGKTPSQHVAALWELVRADEREAAVTYFMCDVVGMPKIIGFLFRFFPMWPKPCQYLSNSPPCARKETTRNDVDTVDPRSPS